jgi:hypothetical protein
MNELEKKYKEREESVYQTNPARGLLTDIKFEDTE